MNATQPAPRRPRSATQTVTIVVSSMLLLAATFALGVSFGKTLAGRGAATPAIDLARLDARPAQAGSGFAFQNPTEPGAPATATAIPPPPCAPAVDAADDASTSVQQDAATPRPSADAAATETKAEAKKSDEKKADVKKADDKKADEKKSDEKKADVKKADEKKADDKKADEKKADEKKADEKKADEKKADEKKADDRKSAENKPAEKKADDRKSAEKKADEKKVGKAAPFAVQFAAHKSADAAERQVARLRKEGIDVHVEEAEVPGKGRVFRVRTSTYGSKDEAERELRRASSRGEVVKVR